MRTVGGLPRLRGRCDSRSKCTEAWPAGLPSEQLEACGLNLSPGECFLDSKRFKRILVTH